MTGCSQVTLRIEDDAVVDALLRYAEEAGWYEYQDGSFGHEDAEGQLSDVLVVRRGTPLEFSLSQSDGPLEFEGFAPRSVYDVPAFLMALAEYMQVEREWVGVVAEAIEGREEACGDVLVECQDVLDYDDCYSWRYQRSKGTDSFVESREANELLSKRYPETASVARRATAQTTEPRQGGEGAAKGVPPKRRDAQEGSWESIQGGLDGADWAAPSPENMDIIVSAIPKVLTCFPLAARLVGVADGASRNALEAVLPGDELIVRATWMAGTAQLSFQTEDGADVGADVDWDRKGVGSDYWFLLHGKRIVALILPHISATIQRIVPSTMTRDGWPSLEVRFDIADSGFDAVEDEVRRSLQLLPTDRRSTSLVSQRSSADEFARLGGDGETQSLVDEMATISMSLADDEKPKTVAAFAKAFPELGGRIKEASGDSSLDKRGLQILGILSPTKALIRSEGIRFASVEALVDCYEHAGLPDVIEPDEVSSRLLPATVAGIDLGHRVELRSFLLAVSGEAVMSLEVGDEIPLEVIPPMEAKAKEGAVIRLLLPTPYDIPYRFPFDSEPTGKGSVLYDYAGGKVVSVTSLGGSPVAAVNVSFVAGIDRTTLVHALRRAGIVTEKDARGSMEWRYRSRTRL